MLDGRLYEGNKTFEAPGGPGRGPLSKLVRGPGDRIQPDRSRLLLLMIGSARRTLADVPLAAFSFGEPLVDRRKDMDNRHAATAGVAMLPGLARGSNGGPGHRQFTFH